MNSNNENRQRLSAYLSQLSQDLKTQASASKYRQKYQIKIIELLLSLQQSKIAYDELNLTLMTSRRQSDRHLGQLATCKARVQELTEQNEQLEFEKKAQINQISKLQQNVQRHQQQLQQLKNQLQMQQSKYKKQYVQQQNNWQVELTRLNAQITQLKTKLDIANQDRKELEQRNTINDKQNNQQRRQIQNECKAKMEMCRAQYVEKQRKLVSQCESKCKQLQIQMEDICTNVSRQKYTSTKAMEALENKLKILQKQFQQVTQQKTQLQASLQVNQTSIKQKEKQLKSLRKLWNEQSQQNVQLTEQNNQLKSQLSMSELKRKQLAKRESELKRQLELKSEEFVSENQELQKNKVMIRQLKQQIRKNKEEVENSQLKIKQLQAGLYKNGLMIQEQKKKNQQLSAKYQYVQASNIKLNEKIVLEQKHRESIIKTIVNQKDSVEKQNLKLLQLLEIRQNMLRAVMEAANQIDQPKIGQIGIQVKSRDRWAGLIKENLKDPTARRSAIDKWILN